MLLAKVGMTVEMKNKERPSGLGVIEKVRGTWVTVRWNNPYGRHNPRICYEHELKCLGHVEMKPQTKG